jgi:putative oxidoreductase
VGIEEHQAEACLTETRFDNAGLRDRAAKTAFWISCYARQTCKNLVLERIFMTSMKNIINLDIFDRCRDAAALVLRVATGTFIVDGVWDNIVSGERMTEFVKFMGAAQFPMPGFWAPFSVYTQFIAGLLIILGLFTRWGGLVLVATFLVGLIMVHWQQSLREMWPALALVVIGATLVTQGGGRWSVDGFLTQKG